MVVQITFLKIGEIDTKKECFDADVLVIAKWREPQLDRDSEHIQVTPSFGNRHTHTLTTCTFTMAPFNAIHVSCCLQL